MTSTRSCSKSLLLLLLTLACLPAALAQAGATTNDRVEPLPKELEGVGIEQKPGARVPLDLRLIDENGRGVMLGEYFVGRPVLLDLGYYQCPMLCNLVLNGMVDALRPLDFLPGRDFEVVVVSIDPSEQPELARAKKASYVRSYGKPGTENGWHFLTGSDENVKKLARAVGFNYRWVPETREFAHSAGLFVLTPEGVISRVVPGMAFESQTLRLALAEASNGRVGTVVDQFLLFCFHYDAEAGRYGWAATRLMKVGGALTVLALGTVLITLWSRERRRRPASHGPEASA